jgi:hypothetical protein
VTTIGVTGHQNIPSEALIFVQEGIADVIRWFDGLFTGVSSLAAGADQLFADTLLRSGGRLYALIPCRGYEKTFSNQGDLQHSLIFSVERTL